jgi:hypothetical protein
MDIACYKYTPVGALMSFCHCCLDSRTPKRQNPPVRSWENIADNLKKAGWSWGCVSAVDCEGRTIWIADAHRDGEHFIVRADEKLTAFIELEATIRKRAQRGQVGEGEKRRTVALG